MLFREYLHWSCISKNQTSSGNRFLQEMKRNRYRDLLAQQDVKTRELSSVMDDLEKHPPADGDPGSSGRIS